MEKHALEKLGYKVVPKTDGCEALLAFEKESDKFDLVISERLWIIGYPRLVRWNQFAIYGLTGHLDPLPGQRRIVRSGSNVRALLSGNSRIRVSISLIRRIDWRRRIDRVKWGINVGWWRIIIVWRRSVSVIPRADNGSAEKGPTHECSSSVPHTAASSPSASGLAYGREGKRDAYQYNNNNRKNFLFQSYLLFFLAAEPLTNKLLQ